MYGKYKEIILENLNNYYNTNEKQFHSILNKYTSMLKENTTIKTFDDIYSLIENSQFNEQFYAKEFLDECINYLKQLNKTGLKELKQLTENLNTKTPQSKNEIRENIDNVVFSKDLEKRTNSKIKLINHLVGNNDTSSNELNEELQPIFNTLIEERLKRTLGELNEQELKVVKSYINNDNNTLNEEYNKLIDQVKIKLEEKENNYSDSEKINLIKKSKSKLDEMKNTNPTEDNIEKLITLTD